jgi:serine protease Do
VTIGRLVEDKPAAPKAGVRTAPKSRSKGKDKQKDGQLVPPLRWLGLALSPLTDELRTTHRLGSDVKGVLVIEVDPASPAAGRGVRAGDVIVEVANQPVGTVEDVGKAVESVRTAGRNVLLRLEDATGELRFVAVPAG